MINYREFTIPEKVCLGNGRSVDAIGVGSIFLSMLFKVSEPKTTVLQKVLYVPKLACNLFSVRVAVAKASGRPAVQLLQIQEVLTWPHSNV